MAQRFYFVPSETVVGDSVTYYGPLYFSWRFGTGTLPPLGFVDYAFTGGYLVIADLLQADHDTLVLNPDVASLPENLDQAVAPQDQVVDLFDGWNLPTDWLTPATTYRELLHSTMGMIQFNQRYSGISGGHSIFESADLNTRLRQMTAEEQAWFLATVESFGFDSGLINDNSQLRLLVRQAASYWDNQTFIMGGVEF